ncbi:MAG: hypothetical protein A2451_02185 [Bdellovibrionales bacterium RIFOXYC2_FULL_39_8]|nr:MAG: hypothetical protein A2451_02185 [Bdellovibrionales bacterium RIFOXYC2_FULL_39_8]
MSFFLVIIWMCWPIIASAEEASTTATTATASSATDKTVLAVGSAKERLEEAQRLFAKKAYVEAIELATEIADSLSADGKVVAEKYYLLGLAYSRTNQYDKAADAFLQALKLKYQTEEIAYEYGQVLYAINKLNDAIEEFKKSAERNFKVDSSLYYVAHIYQLLNDYKNAGSYYLKLIKNGGNANLIAVSHLQVGELYLQLGEQERISKKGKRVRYKKEFVQKIVQTKVLPALEEGLKIADDPQVKIDITKRYKEIKKFYDLANNILASGRELPESRWELSLGQLIKYDTNVTAASEDSNATATKYSSIIYDTSFAGKYRFLFAKRLLVYPALALTYTNHDNRKSSVIVNDGYTISPGIQTKLEHSLFSKLSYLYLNLDYMYEARDINAQEKYEEDSQNLKISLEEEINYFKQGSTIIKSNYKFINKHDDGYDGHALGLGLTQIQKMSGVNLTVYALAYDAYSYDNDYYDYAYYVLRVNYMLNGLPWGFSMKIGGAVSALDTLKQSSVRGLEFNINPYFSISHTIWKKISATLSYDYISNISKDEESYTYSKHVVGLQLQASF